MKPRANIAPLAALALAAWAGCTAGNTHYQIMVEAGRQDRPGVGPDLGGAGGGGAGGTGGGGAGGGGAGGAGGLVQNPDAADGSDLAPAVDTIVVVDAALPADASTPADAPAVDTGLPADTAAPVDAAGPVDTAAPADTAAPIDTAAPLVNGIRGAYYSGRDHNNFLFERPDQTINFNWVHDSPDPRVPVDDFSVKWYARLQPRYSERYTLSIVSDDGARLMIDGQYVIDKWTSQSSLENSYQVNLTAGQLYDIQVEYFDRQLTALVRFYWASPSQAKEIVPYSRLFTR